MAQSPAEKTPPEANAQARPPKKKRRMLRVLGWTLGVILVLALGAGGFGWYTVQRSFPQTTGTIEAAGLESPVTVQRDGSGVPVITAENGHDLFFAQGFVHAQDRFWEMDFRRHLTAGRLSELFGESQLGTDIFLRSLGWHDVAQQEVEALPSDTRAYYEAYAEGVNAYLAQRQGASLSLEYAILGLQNPGYEPEPWRAVDSVAWLKAMAWDLRTNIEDETERALLLQDLDLEQLEQLYPAYPFDEHPVIVDKNWSAELPESSALQDAGGAASALVGVAASQLRGGTSAALAAVDEMISAQGEGIGSNSWVVSGAHTDTGKPLLANDPHLGASLPSVWSQIGLRCATVSEECPFDVAGFSFSGLPGIVIGHNQHMAWGFTNLTTDVADLYLESVDGESYWKDGELRPLSVRQETISVAGGEDVQIEVRSTEHGPIVSGLTPDFTEIAEHANGVSADQYAPPGEIEVSLRWTALDPGSTAAGIFEINRAENFEEFRRAASLFDVPAQNLIYADPEGNIGYQTPGRLPIRGAGDGWLPQPGWDSAFDWQGFIPFEELPSLYNPESGYIVTANNAIVSDDYPYPLSRDWDYGYRAARIVELLEQRIAAGPVSAQDLADLHMDNQMPTAEALQRAYAPISVEDEGVQRALDALAAWDGQNGIESSEAAFANVLWSNVATLMIGGKSEMLTGGGHSRLTRVFEEQLDRPDSIWWRNSEAGVSSQEELLRSAAQSAYDEIVELQGSDPAKWNWGDLHAITLTHETFGSSGIRPIEMLFNRGPYATGGGSGVVNATGWVLGEGYATSTVPSMRMVVDVSDWDASTWVHLTGASGHAFHKHYTDQTEDWANGVQRPWPYTPAAVDTAAKDTLVLAPAG